MTNVLTGLPDIVTRYLAARSARATAATLACFADGAVVTDEGRTYRGTDEIRAWLEGSISGYTFTTEHTAAERPDDDHVLVHSHLEGDFPGGVADLTYRFTLTGDAVSELVIEP